MIQQAASGLVGQTAAALAGLVRAGRVSAADVVRAHVDWIAALDPQIGAFQIVRAERAIAEAEALAAREDLRQLPLAGVPVAIKDNVAVAGEAMRIGSLATSESRCAADHETVRRLRSAGAIVVGITRVPELCVWATTDTADAITRNPWNLDRTSGGSSGGSAAAVASGMAPLALGADGMGSIRIPAAACGVFGLKPGAGIVPSYLGVSSWYGLAENGPLATTVEDAALMLSVLAQRPQFARVEPPAGPLRIAVTTRSPVMGVSVDREWSAAALESANRLANAGHSVQRAEPPAMTLRGVVSTLAHWLAGAAEDARALDEKLLERRTRTHVRLGRIALRLALVGSREREAWRQINEPFFNRFDLLLTPVLASVPIRSERWSQHGWAANVYSNVRFAPFTAPWNLAGYPAAAVPAGVHSDGTPLSVQLIGSAGGEARILSVAKQLEMLRPWSRHAPHAGIVRANS